MLVVIVVVIAFFVSVAIKPRIVWALVRWQYRRPEYVEPSQAYFTVTRVSAVAVALFGFFGVFLPLLADRREADNGPHAPDGKEYRSTVAAARELDERVRRLARGGGLRRPELVERAAHELAVECFRELGVDEPTEDDLRRGCGEGFGSADDYAATGHVSVTPIALDFDSKPVCLTMPATPGDDSVIEPGLCAAPAPGA